MPKEPSFDEIINPKGHDWDDEIEEYYFSGMTANRPKHEKKEKPNMLTKTIQFLAKVALVGFMIVAILWIAGAIGDLLTTLIPF